MKSDCFVEVAFQCGRIWKMAMALCMIIFFLVLQELCFPERSASSIKQQHHLQQERHRHLDAQDWAHH
jgi:hypothetical protein